MIVLDVKRGLKRLRSATRSQLAAELGESPGAVEAALAYWESRGRVRRLAAVYAPCAPVACSSCPITATCGTAGADAPADEYLEWIAEATSGDPSVADGIAPARR